MAECAHDFFAALVESALKVEVGKEVPSLRAPPGVVEAVFVTPGPKSGGTTKVVADSGSIILTLRVC